MPAGRVKDTDKIPAADKTALDAAVATYPEQYKKDRLNFLYEQLSHSGMSHAAALAQAIRQTT